MIARCEFPLLPRWLCSGEMTHFPCWMRPFGTAEDLAIDFHFARRPELITELLLRCCETRDGGSVDRSVLVEMPISMRMEALLMLATLGDTNQFVWRVRCANAECEQESEFELIMEQLRALMDEEMRERRTIQTLIEGIIVTLRRPTGSDQEVWIRDADETEGDAMIRSIVVAPSFDELLAAGLSIDVIAQGIDEVMDSFDPLLSFHVNVICSHCGISSDVSPDLIGAALERLSRVQRTMMDEVHRLALRYHWSERQILELPKWRRQSYLQLTEQAALQL